MPEVGTPSLHRLDSGRRGDFFRLHSPENGCGLCFCVAWWVPSWVGWGERTAEMNRALREDLFSHGHDDGYLAYQEGEPVGWVQVGPRDRLEKLVREYGLPPDPGAWAITCLLVAPGARRLGLARFLVGGVVDDLPQRGATAVEAFPRAGEGLPAEDVWTGPEKLFASLGFVPVQSHPRRPRYRLDLPAGAPSV